MLKISVNQKVLEALASAFPTPIGTANRALDKYVRTLEKLLFNAMQFGRTPEQRKLDTYGISLQRLANLGGQIGPKRKRVHAWLRENKLELVKTVVSGSNLTGRVSDVKLTELVYLENRLVPDQDAIDMFSTDAEFKACLAGETSQQVVNFIYPDLVDKADFFTSNDYDPLEVDQSDKFPTFEVEEVNAILANFPGWIARATSEPKRQQRQMLFDYVRILIDTGARPGKELLDLQWKKIRVKIVDRAEPKRVVDEDGQVQSITHEQDEEGLLDEIFARDYYVFMNVSGKTKERTANGFEQSFKVLTEIVGRNYAGERTSLKKLTEKNDERFVFRTKDGLAPGSFNHVFESFLEEHNLLVDPVTGRNRVFYSLRSTYATTVMNYDAVPIRDLSKQLGNSVGIIQKHYDRATGEAIVENIKAPNAKKALFDTSKVRDIYKSKKAML